jgi:transposase
MMVSLPTSVRIWLATRATDLRKSFDSLAELVRRQLAGDPLSSEPSLPTAERSSSARRNGSG